MMVMTKDVIAQEIIFTRVIPKSYYVSHTNWPFVFCLEVWMDVCSPESLLRLVEETLST